MRDPDEALRSARAAAAGRTPGAGSSPWQLPDGPVSTKRLAQWAIIEPDQVEVYSTRVLGAPITRVKRLLIRLLSQYLNQMTAQQSRFNAHIAANVMKLEQRVTALEQALEHGERSPRAADDEPSR